MKNIPSSLAIIAQNEYLSFRYTIKTTRICNELNICPILSFLRQTLFLPMNLY